MKYALIRTSSPAHTVVLCLNTEEQRSTETRTLIYSVLRELRAICVQIFLRGRDKGVMARPDPGLTPCDGRPDVVGLAAATNVFGNLEKCGRRQVLKGLLPK